MGGYNSSNDKEFFVGLMFEEDTLKPFCEGSLIDAQWVLTAAHCVTDPQTMEGIMDTAFLFVNAYSLSNPNLGYEKIHSDKVLCTPHIQDWNGKMILP